jgi:membrane-associated protein
MIDLNSLADLAGYAYLVIFALAALDVVFPVLPSESAVILGGVLAWQGRLGVVPLVLAAAAGAIAGDHLSYGLGRWTHRGGRPQRSHTKAAQVQAWAAQQLDTRGASMCWSPGSCPAGARRARS